MLGGRMGVGQSGSRPVGVSSTEDHIQGSGRGKPGRFLMADDPELERLARISKIIAKGVYDAIEGDLSLHLSREQRAGLGPRIRNVIYSTLVGIYYGGDATAPQRSRNALVWLSILMASIPADWSGPELSDDLKALLSLPMVSDPVSDERRSKLAGTCRDELGL